MWRMVVNHDGNGGKEVQRMVEWEAGRYGENRQVVRICFAVCQPTHSVGLASWNSLSTSAVMVMANEEKLLHLKSVSQWKQLSFEDGLRPCMGLECTWNMGVCLYGVSLGVQYGGHVQDMDGSADFNECKMWKTAMCKCEIWKGWLYLVASFPSGCTVMVMILSAWLPHVHWFY